MKKRKFYNELSKKHDLPVKFIKFIVDTRYFYKANIDVSVEELENIENQFIWENVQENFESARLEYASMFYHMKRPSEEV